MPAGGRPTARSRRLGAALKRYRQAAQFDQPQASEVIATSQARISRIESGHASARVIDVRLLLDAYGVTDQEVRDRLEGLAKPSSQRGWWLEHAELLRPEYLDHIALEDDATCIREWQPMAVPGLLQTPAYAEAIISTGPRRLEPQHIAHLVKVRQERQAKIADGGTEFIAILWELIVTRSWMGADIHREQLSWLLELGKRRNVTVQILPLAAGALAASRAAFCAFSFDAERTVEAVSMDGYAGGATFHGAEELTAYADMFDVLRSSALTPDASARLIRHELRTSKEDVR